MKFFILSVIVSPILALSLACTASKKTKEPLVKELALRTDSACSIYVRFDRNLYKPEQIKNAYQFLVKEWSTVTHSEDWELTRLEQADFPTLLQAEKERLLRFNKIVYAIKASALPSPQRSLEYLKLDYSLGTGCLDYIKNSAEKWTDCQKELEQIFPQEERLAAFDKAIISRSEAFNCEP